MKTAEDAFREKYKIVCRVCGSDECTIYIDEGHTYSEHTQTNSTVSFGCPACGPKQDLVLDA